MDIASVLSFFWLRPWLPTRNNFFLDDSGDNNSLRIWWTVLLLSGMSWTKTLLSTKGTLAFTGWNIPWKLHRNLEDVRASGRTVRQLVSLSCLPFSMSIALISSLKWGLQCYWFLFILSCSGSNQSWTDRCCTRTWVVISLYNTRNNASMVFSSAISICRCML